MTFTESTKKWIGVLQQVLPGGGAWNTSAVVDLPVVLSDFAPHNMTDFETPEPYGITAETYLVGYPWSVLDEDAADEYWVGYPGLMIIDIGSQKKLLSYSIKAHDRPTQMAKAWTLSGSIDGVTYDVIDTVNSQESWSTDEVRNFICDVYVLKYQFFKFDITESTGGAFVGFKELYLFEDLNDQPAKPLAPVYYPRVSFRRPTSRRIIGSAEGYMAAMQQLLPQGFAFNKKYEKIVSKSSNVYVYEDGIFDFEDGIGEII